MHRHRSVSSRTISLEKSAYDLLKAAKRPGESFTDVVRRMLGDREPRFGDLVGLLGKKTSDRLYNAFNDARFKELNLERRREKAWRRPGGNNR